MQILNRAKRTTAALTLLAASWAVVLGSAPPAVADDPPPAPATPAAKPTPVPHLSSPDNLPPYTTDTSDGSQDPDRLSYLKEVWHAYQDHDISPSQALVLLAQRPMDAAAAPPPGLPADPQPPTSPGPPSP